MQWVVSFEHWCDGLFESSTFSHWLISLQEFATTIEGEATEIFSWAMHNISYNLSRYSHSAFVQYPASVPNSSPYDPYRVHATSLPLSCVFTYITSSHSWAYPSRIEYGLPNTAMKSVSRWWRKRAIRQHQTKKTMRIHRPAKRNRHGYEVYYGELPLLSRLRRWNERGRRNCSERACKVFHSMRKNLLPWIKICLTAKNHWTSRAMLQSIKVGKAILIWRHP